MHISLLTCVEALERRLDQRHPGTTARGRDGQARSQRSPRPGVRNTAKHLRYCCKHTPVRPPPPPPQKHKAIRHTKKTNAKVRVHLCVRRYRSATIPDTLAGGVGGWGGGWGSSQVKCGCKPLTALFQRLAGSTARHARQLARMIFYLDARLCTKLYEYVVEYLYHIVPGRCPRPSLRYLFICIARRIWDVSHGYIFFVIRTCRTLLSIRVRQRICCFAVFRHQIWRAYS